MQQLALPENLHELHGMPHIIMSMHDLESWRHSWDMPAAKL